MEDTITVVVVVWEVAEEDTEEAVVGMEEAVDMEEVVADIEVVEVKLMFDKYLSYALKGVLLTWNKISPCRLKL